MAATDLETPYAGGGYSTRTAETQGSELCSSAGSRGEGEREGRDMEAAFAVDMFAAEFATLSEAADAAAESWSFSEPQGGTWNPCSYCRRGVTAAPVLSPFPEPASSSFSLTPSSASPSAFCGLWAFSPLLQYFRSRSVPRLPPFVEGMRLRNGDFVEVFCLPCINVGVSQSSASFNIPLPADLRSYVGPPALQYRGLPQFIGYNKPVVIHRVYLSSAAEEELKQHQRQLLQQRRRQHWAGQRLQHQDQGLWQEEAQMAEGDHLEQGQQQEVEEETHTLQNQGQQERDEEEQQEQFSKQSYPVDSGGQE